MSGVSYGLPTVPNWRLGASATASPETRRRWATETSPLVPRWASWTCHDQGNGSNVYHHIEVRQVSFQFPNAVIDAGVQNRSRCAPQDICSICDTREQSRKMADAASAAACDHLHVDDTLAAIELIAYQDFIDCLANHRSLEDAAAGHRRVVLAQTPLRAGRKCPCTDGS